MKKLRLELDGLVVESFSPERTPPVHGTVRGYVSLYWEDCSPSETCAGAGWPCDPTDQSCGGTCDATCAPGGCGSGAASCGCSGWASCGGMTTCLGVNCEDTG